MNGIINDNDFQYHFSKVVHVGENMMFYQIKSLVVKEGTSDKVLERFKGESLLEKQSGFINLNV